MGRYTKAISALVAGLAVAIPSLVAASQDNNISVQEWLTAAGLFFPAIVVALSPANALAENQLVEQVRNHPAYARILERLRGSSEPKQPPTFGI